MRITSTDISNAEERKKRWAFSNMMLYDLCREYPKHDREDVVLAKVLTIGRIYAASIERRRHSVESAKGDAFYVRVVAPKIMNSALDEWIAALPAVLSPNRGELLPVLKAHRLLTKLFREISGLEKRSLASKYLHFHRPDLFFIFDSRAYRAVRAMEVGKEPQMLGDPEYSSFFGRCMNLRDRVNEEFHIKLTPRQLDDLLIAVSERL
jgi:uncharacterized membrane protein